MNECQSCETYTATRGKGTRSCLKCQWYKEFKAAFNGRQPIAFLRLPEEVLEQVPDTSDEKTVIDAVRQLPADLSAVIVMHYYAKLSQEEISVVIGKSQATVSKRMTTALDRLKGLMQ